MFKLPSPLPLRYVKLPGEPTTPTNASASATFDVAFNGQGFRLSNSVEKPIIRQLADLTKNRVDQAAEAGEQTLTNWWFGAQSSFHGGAGQLNLTPAFPTPYDKIRFDTSKNLDVWTPGKVTVLPAARSVVGVRGAGLLSLTKAGADAFAYMSGVNAILIQVGTGVSPTDVTTTIAAPAALKDLCTDGSRLFCVTTAGKVYRADVVSAWAWVEMYTGATAPSALAWVNDRLMLGDGLKVYQLGADHTPSSALGAGELVYTHPTVGYVWDGFTKSPAAILGFGWNGRTSDFTQFTLTNSAGTVPTLTAAGVLAELPSGERLITAKNTMGSFLGMTTSKGVRVGQFESFRGNLTLGPLTVAKTGLSGCSTDDRFLYVAVQAAPDEPGLLRIDLGSQVDQAGRYAWTYDRIGPTSNATVQANLGAVAVLPVTGRVAFTDDQGVYVSDPVLALTRSGWLRTSRVRYGTTEPKLFKFGRIRGDYTSGSVTVVTTGSDANTRQVFTWAGAGDTDEFALPAGKLEWLQYTLTVGGSGVLTGYLMKALPGTRRQQMIRVVVSCQDRESTRSGAASVHPRSSQGRRDALMELAALGDQVSFQEYQQTGTITTQVVIEQCEFDQVGRPTPQQFTGGDIIVTMRTIN